jgi:hypothetical protein
MVSGLVVGFTEHLHIVITNNSRFVFTSRNLQFTATRPRNSHCAMFLRLSGNGFQRRSFHSFRAHFLTAQEFSPTPLPAAIFYEDFRWSCSLTAYHRSTYLDFFNSRLAGSVD